MRTGAGETRRKLVARAFAVEALAIAWMAFEPVAAIGAALRAGSLSLLAFGLDGVIELASGIVVAWRLHAELAHGRAVGERAESVARRIAAVLLALLAVYVAAAALWKLQTAAGENASLLGFAVALLEIPIMFGIAAAKLRLAERLGSGALRADAFQATACTWLAASVVVGLAAQSLVAAWWIDAATSLVIGAVLLREAALTWPRPRSDRPAPDGGSARLGAR